MKKNKFQQEKQDKQKQNFFDEEQDINLEEDGLFEKEALDSGTQPYEQYFEKFNQLYNSHIEKFQAFEVDYQIPLTNPDYESLIQNHFMVYEKNVGLFDFARSDNKLFDKICVSFVYVDNQVRQIEEQFYKYLDKLTIYGELNDIHFDEEKKLQEGEAEIMISRMLSTFKQIYDIIKKLINFVTHSINQLNLLYNKKDPISKSMKVFNLTFPLDTIGRALSLIYVLDSVVEQNDYLQQHWNYYKRVIKIVKSDITKYNTTPLNLKTLEKILIRLDKTVLSGSCLQGVLNQNWDQNVHEKTGKEKSSNIPAMKNNKDLYQLMLSYIKDRFEIFDKIIGTSREVFERDLVLPTLCVYALMRKLFSEEDRSLWKNMWALQKKLPMVEGHSQVLCYVSKFLMEVTPLTKKSLTMDPKDPIANFKSYLNRLSLTFQSNVSALYVQFTAWLVRVDSFATSQASFHNIDKVNKEKARELIEERMNIRASLVMNGLQIASQTRQLLQSLLLGHFGLEEQSLDQSLVRDVVLAVQMLKAIEYQFEAKYDIFQPALLQHHITKNGQKLIAQAIQKLKGNLKGFGNGATEVLSALQIVNNILKNTLSPIKLETFQVCMDFILVKDTFKDTEKEEFKYIYYRLDKIILLPHYLRKVTASTYFYWCRDLLPLFFQTIYQVPQSAKRFQFLLNSISDCSVQLQGCLHLDQPDGLFESFRKYVVQTFYQEYLLPLARDIEDYLRIQVHTILIDKITALNPFKQSVKDIKRLLDVDQVLIFDSVVNLRQEINLQLNETFYNMNVLNMYDQETYEQMRSLANFKFGLHLMNVYLPSQTVDQGSFDVLDILKNISKFLSKYTYNIYQQQFVQVTSESKQVYSISIQQISDSIRTHGLGILSTTVNSVYNHLRKKIQVFSQFLFDDYIQAPLVREERFFREQKDALDGIYPFDRAEAYYKEVKKMGQFDDGSNYLDKFRVLITQIGNALAFVRLLRSAALNFSSKSLEYLPYQHNSAKYEQQAKDAGFSEASIASAKELDDVFTSLKTSFSDQTDFVGILTKVFATLNNPDNKHLKTFYLIIPALTINYIEKMLIVKDQLGKRNSTTEVFISDDGFILGIQYFLNLLDQKSQFDSLHWRKEIKSKFQKDMKAAKQLANTATAKGQQSQRAVEEINMQNELSSRKLKMQYEEYQMFFYAFNSCKVLFIEK